MSGLATLVVLYEDQYFEEFHKFWKRLRQHQKLPALVLEGRTAKGTGGFVNELGPLLRTPLRQTKRPPDKVVCLADADRPKNLFSSAPLAPIANADIARWIDTLEQDWKAHLVKECSLSPIDAARVETGCLCWSKESVLLTSEQQLLAFAGDGAARVQQVVEACTPKPSTVLPAEYTYTYRAPQKCMDQVFQAATNGLRKYKKGRDDEDLLREHFCSMNDAELQAVCERCPDLVRLVSKLAVP